MKIVNTFIIHKVYTEINDESRFIHIIEDPDSEELHICIPNQDDSKSEIEILKRMVQRIKAGTCPVPPFGSLREAIAWLRANPKLPNGG